MNLKQKLALRSTLVCAITLLLVFGSIFYLAKSFTTNTFYSRLENRALLSAIIFLEKDELHKKKYQEYEKRYLNTLEQETLQIYDAHNNVAFVPEIPSHPVDAQILDQIRKKGKLNFQADGMQHAGLFYQDNQGDFVIVSSGVYVTGQERLYLLKIILVILFIVGVLINYIFSVLVANKTFKPFSSILRQVNTISTENLNSRLPQLNKPGNELGDLTLTLNTLLERLESGVNHQKHFLRNVSHELKTPLAAIMGEAELSLEKERSPEEYRQVLQKIVKNTAELNSVIEGLLLISGLANKTSHVKARPFRLDELLWEVLEKLHFKYPDAEVETIMEVEDSEVLQLHSYPELIATAITNIIDNALKFTDDQKVTLRIALNEQGRVALLVQDHGPGIPEQEQEKVFDLFYRGSNTQYLKPGHGVGLSLTKHITSFCHIDLSISSVPHQGTEVKLVFPAA